MSKRFDILPSDGVFVGELKHIRFKVVDENDAPFPMTGKSLSWTLRMGSGTSPIVLLKTSGLGQITLTNGDAVDDVAIVTIEPGDTLGPGGAILVSPGAYVHALKDETDEAVLSDGDFALGLAAAH